MRYWICVLLRNTEEKQKFKKLMLFKAIRAVFKKTLFETLTVSAVKIFRHFTL